MDLKFGFKKGKHTTLNHSDPVDFGVLAEVEVCHLQIFRRALRGLLTKDWSQDCCQWISIRLHVSDSRHQISQQILD